MESVRPEPRRPGPALPPGIWDGVVAVIGAAYYRDYHGLQLAGLTHPVLADRTHAYQTALALRTMAYIALARRIDHRPIEDGDALAAATELAPAINTFSKADVVEIADAARLALYLPASSNLADSSVANRIGGLWIAIIGTRVESLDEVNNMKADVEHVLRGVTSL